jgi:hypothetical protein
MGPYIKPEKRQLKEESMKKQDHDRYSREIEN